MLQGKFGSGLAVPPFCLLSSHWEGNCSEDLSVFTATLVEVHVELFPLPWLLHQQVH